MVLRSLKMKRKRCRYISRVKYSNGIFKAGIIKNNNPKYDVIRLWIYLKRQSDDGKSISIENQKIDLTVDEALAVNCLLNDAIWRYMNRHIDEVRNWELK